jgi:uncharacterized membrane protein
LAPSAKAKQADKPKAATPKKAVESKAAEAAMDLVPKAGPGGSLARKAMTKAASRVVRRAARSGAEALRGAAQRALEASSTAVDPADSRRPPVQCSVEAGVPIRVAWDEWMRLTWLPEGVDRVQDIKRKRGGRLAGRLGGSADAAWEAEILDQREQESFAWQSHRGSDCAGLATFHELGDRLTRIELNLDVVPTTLAAAAALTTRLADRRTAAELRRFKAHLELINPDLYEDEDGGDG